MRCEGCIFYELSNGWQVNDTMYSDILAVQVIQQHDHQVCNICSSLNCSCSWMLNLLKLPIPKAVLKYTGNAFSSGALLSKRLTLLYIWFFSFTSKIEKGDPGQFLCQSRDIGSLQTLWIGFRYTVCKILWKSYSQVCSGSIFHYAILLSFSMEVAAFLPSEGVCIMALSRLCCAVAVGLSLIRYHPPEITCAAH